MTSIIIKPIFLPDFTQRERWANSHCELHTRGEVCYLQLPCLLQMLVMCRMLIAVAAAVDLPHVVPRHWSSVTEHLETSLH